MSPENKDAKTSTHYPVHNYQQLSNVKQRREWKQQGLFITGLEVAFEIFVEVEWTPNI